MTTADPNRVAGAEHIERVALSGYGWGTSP